MNSSRLEAFSDGVMAIIITIMVLEFKVPQDVTLQALSALMPVFLCYVISFVYVGIYWVNHHHLLYTLKLTSVGSDVLWANLALLFWMSLIPFSTAWMGEHDFAQVPMMVYAVNLSLTAISYFVLQYRVFLRHDGSSGLDLGKTRNLKGLISVLLYILAIPLVYVSKELVLILWVLIAIMWWIPSRRIERAFSSH